MINTFYLGPSPGLIAFVRPVLLILIALATAVFWHRRERRFWRACLWATLTSSVLFYIVALSGLVYRAPFILNIRYFYLAMMLHMQAPEIILLGALVGTIAGSFVIAVLSGLVLRRRGADRPGLLVP